MSTLAEIRDAFQQRLLTFLFRGAESSSLVLKGGGAMRVLTGSARYTQDLYFDHDPRRSLARLQKTIGSAIDRALKGSGLVEASVTAPKQTDTVARWKVSAVTEMGRLQLTVEVSRRARPDPEHIVSIPIQVSDLTLPRVYVAVYDDRAQAGQKLSAILDVRRTAVRDLYDLELLLSRDVCPAAAIIDSLGGGDRVLKGVAAKLDLMDWPMFRDQVLPTLPSEIHSHIDEDEYLEMKVRLRSALARCIGAQPSSAMPR